MNEQTVMAGVSWPGAAVVLGIAILGLSACGPGEAGEHQAALAIDAASLIQGIQDLSADSMGGRAPSSIGEERTVQYLTRRFQELGLEPGAGGVWTQDVALVSISADPDMGAAIRGRGTENHLQHGTDFVAVAGGPEESVVLSRSPLVFAGYGIVAPEIAWNDYEGLDLTGKTVVLLVNDPGYETGDDRFDGRAMTYYGRWTYKFEEAARQGAAAVMIVHRTGPAGYPWAVVETGWSGPQFMLDQGQGGSDPIVQGWFSEETTRAVFAQAGLDLDSLAGAAGQDGFRAVELGLDLSLELRNEMRRSDSRNVIARIPGGTRPEEHVVYLGHWDHMGTDPALSPDSIYNGALDNASGIAGLLELAEAYMALERRPERSVLFIALTAEEQGLLGSKHYARNPVWPLESTVAAINVDGLNIWGPTRDLVVVGYGKSELDSVLAEVAADQDRVLEPDSEPEKGYFFRSDHFEFAKQGVPALFPNPGIDDLRYGKDWARAQHDQFTAERYHKPADEYDPNWNLEGAVDDLRLLFEFGFRLADSDAWPNWRERSEFRPIRDEMRRVGP
jgi:Zn-dependent M28 family amino/carboxypeptidase